MGIGGLNEFVPEERTVWTFLLTPKSECSGCRWQSGIS